MMKVILKPVGLEPRQILIPNDMYILQQLVDGYVQPITLTSDMLLLCDEDGRVKGKKMNCTIMGIPFYGDIVLVGTKRGNFCDVPITIEQAKKVRLMVYETE